MSEVTLSMLFFVNTLLPMLFFLLKLYRLVRQPSRLKKREEIFATIFATVLAIAFVVYMGMVVVFSGADTFTGALGTVLLGGLLVLVYGYVYLWAGASLFIFIKQIIKGRRSYDERRLGFFHALWATLLLGLFLWGLTIALLTKEKGFPTKLLPQTLKPSAEEVIKLAVSQ